MSGRGKGIQKNRREDKLAIRFPSTKDAFSEETKGKLPNPMVVERIFILI